MTLPETTTPAALAEHMGVSERFVRSLARKLGACRILGKRMILLDEDVTAIKEGVGTLGLRKAQYRKHLDFPSFIYFVQSREFIKIGWSENWRRRLANMQTSNPDPIKVLLVLTRPKSWEADLHKQFAAHAHRGEWFKDHPDIRTFIKERKEECRYRPGKRK